MDKQKLAAGMKKAMDYLNTGEDKKALQAVEVVLMTFRKARPNRSEQSKRDSCQSKM